MPVSGRSTYGDARRHRQLLRDYRDGAVAGLLAGTTLIVLFFVYDVLSFAPLATPDFLSGEILGSEDPGAELAPMLRTVRIAIFTLLHLAAFAFLGIGLARLHHFTQLKNAVLAGALYGLTACTLLFGVSLQVSGTQMSAVPGWPAILLGNVAAGIVMGVYLRWAQGAVPSR
jgi:hypothetical protein